MGIVKNCTTIEQAMVLMGFLPLESADYCYKCIGDNPYDLVCRPYSDYKEEYKGLLTSNDVTVVPCWSLASLFSLLPVYVYNNEDCLILRMDKSNVDFNIWYDNFNTGTVEESFDVTGLNELDACFDADRLDLTRCGIIPDPYRMATKHGADIARQIQRNQ